MAYRISGLPVEAFAALFDLEDAELERRGIRPRVADSPQGYPCRITLEDAAVGERVLLLNHAHLAASTPYASSGPIYVRRAARTTRVAVDEVPEQQRRRLLSVRAYDAADMMVDADVVPGKDLESLIERFFADDSVAYLHVHNARPGCYACRVDRA